MKKLTALLIALTLLMTAAFTETVSLGNSGYTMTLNGYEQDTLSQDDIDDGAVLCLYSDTVTLYVLQYGSDGMSPAEAAQVYAGEFDDGESGDVDDSSLAYYAGSEDGDVYIGYIFADGSDLIELQFICDEENADEAINEIGAAMDTLSAGGANTVSAAPAAAAATGNRVKLGSSDLYITIPDGYTSEEPTGDEADEGMTAYYSKESISVEFAVYSENANGYTIADALAEVQSESDVSMSGTTTVNGLESVYYVMPITEDGESYTLIGYMFIDNDTLITLDFYLDAAGTNSAEAAAIVNTIGK